MTTQPHAASCPVEIGRATDTTGTSHMKTQKSVIFHRADDDKELQLPSIYLLLFLWKVGHEIRKFQHDGESPIILKHLGKSGLVGDDGMLPVDQANELWVTCFLDKNIPQIDVGVK